KKSNMLNCYIINFFFQAEDGIRDYKVTGVQTCALPISAGRRDRLTWAGRVGVHFRPQHACNCDLTPGSELTAGAGGTWRFVPRRSEERRVGKECRSQRVR